MDPITVFINTADGSVVRVPDIHEYGVASGLVLDLHDEWEDIARTIMDDDPDIVSIEDEDLTVSVYPRDSD